MVNYDTCPFVQKCVYTKLLQSCLTFCDPMDCGLSGSSVHGILPHPGIEPAAPLSSALQADSLPTEPPREPIHYYVLI